jgi:prevent-host-death family protein
MDTKISATEAVRRFSDILNAVRYRHDSFTILRGGKPVAEIVPSESHVTGKPLRELSEIFKKLPGLNGDNEAFAHDIMEIVRTQPGVPEKSPWV